MNEKPIAVKTKDGHKAIIKKDERSYLFIFPRYWLYIFSRKRPKDIIHGERFKCPETAKNRALRWTLREHVHDITT